jgi:hypothetical protein
VHFRVSDITRCGTYEISPAYLEGRCSIQLSHVHILGYSTDSTKVAKPIRHPILPDPWSNLEQLERAVRRNHLWLTKSADSSVSPRMNLLSQTWCAVSDILVLVLACCDHLVVAADLFGMVNDEHLHRNGLRIQFEP